MSHEDGSVAALGANLCRPLQHWYRSNRSYVWLFCVVYYGLDLVYLAFSAYFHLRFATNPSGGPGAPQLQALPIGYSIAGYLLMLIALLAVIKAPAMMITAPEVELAYSRPAYLRCLINTRLRCTYLLAVVLLLPYPVLSGVLRLAMGTWPWPVGPLMLTNLVVQVAYWLFVAAAAVALSFLKLSNAMEGVAAVVAILGNLIVWMIGFRLGMLMTDSSLLIDQVLVALFRVGIWALLFGTLFYFLHKRFIPHLATRYLTQ